MQINFCGEFRKSLTTSSKGNFRRKWGQKCADTENSLTCSCIFDPEFTKQSIPSIFSHSRLPKVKEELAQGISSEERRRENKGDVLEVSILISI